MQKIVGIAIAITLIKALIVKAKCDEVMKSISGSWTELADFINVSHHFDNEHCI